MASLGDNSEEGRFDAEFSGDSPTHAVTIDVAGSEVATPEEAAALTAALDAYLAAERETAKHEPTETVSQWQFAGRLAGVGERSRRRPRRVERGREWQAAARTL